MIVVCDAGCDPDFAFVDLGNAVRKISIDLGIPIRFQKLERLKRRTADGTILSPSSSFTGKFAILPLLCTTTALNCTRP